MSRTWNFYAGPATLPPAALERAKNEIPDWEGTGMSVMETSHRSPEYDVVHQQATDLMKDLLGLDDENDASLYDPVSQGCGPLDDPPLLHGHAQSGHGDRDARHGSPQPRPRTVSTTRAAEGM